VRYDHVYNPSGEGEKKESDSKIKKLTSQFKKEFIYKRENTYIYLHGLQSVPLAKGNRQGYATGTFFFLFSSSISIHRVLSFCSRKTSFPLVKGGAVNVTLRYYIGDYCTGHKTHRDKLTTSHLLLMERQVFTITHIRMYLVWTRRDHPT